MELRKGPKLGGQDAGHSLVKIKGSEVEGALKEWKGAGLLVTLIESLFLLTVSATSSNLLPDGHDWNMISQTATC